MKIKLTEIKKLVQFYLEKYPETRGDDGMLYMCLCGDISEATGTNLNGMNVITFFFDHFGRSFPTFESIRRARQKVMKEHPELKPPEYVQEKRYQQQHLYHGFSVSLGEDDE